MSSPFISAGSVWGSASTFWYTGHDGVVKLVRSIASASSVRAGYTGEWKPPPTGSFIARFAPAALKYFTSLVDGSLLAGDHQLSGAVVVGAYHYAFNAGAHLFHLLVKLLQKVKCGKI